METNGGNRRGLMAALILVAAVSADGRAAAPPLGAGRMAARQPGENSGGAVFLVRQGQGQPRLEGSLVFDENSGLRFLPGGDEKQGLLLAPDSIVEFSGSVPAPDAIPPLFQVRLGETSRISGRLRLVSEKAVELSVPWQSGELHLARPGVQAVLQRPGEARVFTDRFERIDPSIWSVTGKPELLFDGQGMPALGGARLPAGGTAIGHRLSDPLLAGRLELALLDDGTVAAGQEWTLELVFRGSAGPATLRILLGWAEESLAVESSQVPSLAVQRLARSTGWHRLSVRFGPEQTEVAVDAKELAHGKGLCGPLEAFRLATRATGAGRAAGLAGIVGEIRVVRFAEPPASLEVDPSQDEVRLITGDQLFGSIRRADAEQVVINVDGKPAVLDWSEVAGLYFRRAAGAATAVEGTLVHLQWKSGPGEPGQARDLDFAEGALVSLSDSSITILTPHAGTLVIPRDRLARLRVLGRAWLLVLDTSSHHLGDNISSTPPLLDPPLPEGGTLERTFDLEASALSPRQAFVALDVVQVVGETAGSPYSNLVQKGELRTYVVLNGKRIDYINHFITTSNETPERIRVPIPAGLLKPGKNVLRLEQTGIASDPTWFDDLGVLQLALEFAIGGESGTDHPASPAAKP
jgi:hypothetical protein